MFQGFINWFAEVPLGCIVAVGLAIIMADFARGQFVLDQKTLEIKKIFGRQLITAAAIVAGLLLGVSLALTQGDVLRMMNETVARNSSDEPTTLAVWFHIAFMVTLFTFVMILFGEWVSKTHVKFLVWKKRKIIRIALRDAEEIRLWGQK